MIKNDTKNPAWKAFTCPMHPEITRSSPGACPICGMDLVPVIPSADGEEQEYKELSGKMWVAALFTIPVFLIAMLGMIPANPLLKLLSTAEWDGVQLVLSLPVIYVCRSFFVRAWLSVVTWNLNMFTLVGLGTGVAFLFSLTGLFLPGMFPPEFKTHHGAVALYFEATTVILTLVLLGQLLEAKAHSRTNGAIKALLKLAPTEATLVSGGRDQVIAIDKIVKGDLLRVKPGDKIPVDGHITEGGATIDESMISGEPIPVEKKAGENVISGTINGNTSFIMVAEKVGAETLLARIVEMVSTASRSRAPIQQLTDRIARYFVPAVVLLALITFLAWARFGPEPAFVYGLVNAIAVLIIACPCALGLATPMSVMVGIGKGAGAGILIKDAEALERMDRVNILITDKTGTLTEGKPAVEKVVVVSGIMDDDLICAIASLNQYSEHPLAGALVAFAAARDLSLTAVNDFQAVPGKGVTGTVNQQPLAVGNEALMQQAGAEIPPELAQEALLGQQAGKTISYIAVAGTVSGLVMISDPIKASSRDTVRELMRQGIGVIMLTGDNEHTAAAVARELQLTDFKAGQLPADKLNQIKKLQAEGNIVAMAGDGINDAPALAQADIGIAMGTGTDVAIESAKITLVKGDLKGILQARNLSHAVMRNIKQNLFFAFFYNALGIPVAAGVLYPSFGLLLSPMTAALAMSLSSVSVILNALRLRNSKI